MGAPFPATEADERRGAENAELKPRRLAVQITVNGDLFLPASFHVFRRIQMEKAESENRESGKGLAKSGNPNIQQPTGSVVSGGDFFLADGSLLFRRFLGGLGLVVLQDPAGGP